METLNETHGEDAGLPRQAPIILLIEDEAIVAADIRARLTALGYSVPAIAASAEEAVQRAHELHPDILVVDIVLEGLIDGVEAVRQIRTRLDIPVVYLTAYADEKTVERAKLTEPVGYILKPFDERELRFTIEFGIYKHQVEKRLRDREEQFRQLADHPGEVLWMMDSKSGETLYVSPAYEQVWGRPYRDLPATLDHWVQPVHPDDRPKVLEAYNTALAGKQEDRGLEYRITRPDGSTRWVWSRIYPIFDGAGNVYRIAGTSHDITKQKWAWESLRESEERYRLMADNATDLISRHSPQGVFLYASPASRSLLGYRPEELLGTSAYGYLHPDDADAVRRADGDTGTFLSAGTAVYRIRKKDGTYAWFESSARPVRHPLTGELQEVIAVSRDITGRRQIEESFRRYEFIANASNEFMTLINREYVYEAANAAYCRAHGRERDQIVGTTVADVWGKETFSSVIKGYLDHCFAGTDVHYERWFEFGDKGKRYIAVNYYPYRSERGDVTHAVVVSHDLTDRKRDEDAIHASLKEKEMLLKEIHHRVKNNLQVISSLLNLQSNSIESKETRELVRESQNRVRSMALIHEKLYQSESLAQVQFAEYLRNLTRDLFRSYSAGGVGLKLQAEDIPLDVDTAIPCGLIINELVSNALKYAFPAGRSGDLHVSFLKISRERCALTVTDNGVGLPADIDVKNPKTLGLQLVNMLVNQLHGTLDVVTDGGTTVMVTFAADREALKTQHT
jgi:PAS domain S-box-containing protein